MLETFKREADAAAAESEDALPFRGWRAAGLVALIAADGSVRQLAFESLNQPDIFGVEADAICRQRFHRAPAESCSCGFYALADRNQILSGTFSGALSRDHNVILSVAMSGLVVEGTRGLRASHQTVTGVEVASRCTFCPNPTTHLTPSSPLFTVPDGRWFTLIPVCGKHLPRNVPQLRGMPLEEVEERLGIPTRVLSADDEELAAAESTPLPAPPPDNRSLTRSRWVMAAGAAATSGLVMAAGEPTSVSSSDVLFRLLVASAVGAGILSAVAAGLFFLFRRLRFAYPGEVFSWLPGAATLHVVITSFVQWAATGALVGMLPLAALLGGFLCANFYCGEVAAQVMPTGAASTRRRSLLRLQGVWASFIALYALLSAVIVLGGDAGARLA